MKINFWLNGAKKEAEISPDIMLLQTAVFAPFW